MKKKVIIALVGVFLVLSAAVIAGTVYRDGTIRLIYGSVQAKDVEFTYDIESDGTATITGVKNPKKLRGNVTIPAEIDGYMVKKAEDPVIDVSNKDFITGVTVSEGIERLGFGFFAGAKNLFKVSIPNSVKSIGQFAFYGCKEYESIKVSDGLTYVDGCLVAATTRDKDVKIEDGTRIIASGAFWSADEIEKIYIPESVEYIGTLDLCNLESLESVTVDENNKTYMSKGTCIVEKKTGKVIEQFERKYKNKSGYKTVDG